MRHVAIFCYNLEALDRFRVADNVIQKDWTVLLDPAVLSVLRLTKFETVLTTVARSLQQHQPDVLLRHSEQMKTLP